MAVPYRPVLHDNLEDCSALRCLNNSLQRSHEKRLTDSKQPAAIVETDFVIRLLRHVHPDTIVAAIGSRRGEAVGLNSDVDLFVYHDTRHTVKQLDRTKKETIPMLLWDIRKLLRDFRKHSSDLSSQYKISPEELKEFRRKIDITRTVSHVPKKKGQKSPPLIQFSTKQFSYDISNSLPAYLNSRALHRLVSTQPATYAAVNILRMIIENLGIQYEKDKKPNGFRALHLLALVSKCLQLRNATPLLEPPTREFDKNALQSSAEHFLRLKATALIEETLSISEILAAFAKFVICKDFTLISWSLSTSDQLLRTDKHDGDTVFLVEPFEPKFGGKTNMLERVTTPTVSLFRNQLSHLYDDWVVQRNYDLTVMMARIPETSEKAAPAKAKPTGRVRYSEAPQFENREEEEYFEGLQLWLYVPPEGATTDLRTFVSFVDTRKELAFLLQRDCDRIFNPRQLQEEHIKVFRRFLPVWSEYQLGLNAFFELLDGDIVEFCASTTVDDPNFKCSSQLRDHIEQRDRQIIAVEPFDLTDSIEEMETEQPAIPLQPPLVKLPPLTSEPESAMPTKATPLPKAASESNTWSMLALDDGNLSANNRVTDSGVDKRVERLRETIGNKIHDLVDDVLVSMAKLNDTAYQHLLSDSNFLTSQVIQQLNGVQQHNLQSAAISAAIDAVTSPVPPGRVTSSASSTTSSSRSSAAKSISKILNLKRPFEALAPIVEPEPRYPPPLQGSSQDRNRTDSQPSSFALPALTHRPEPYFYDEQPYFNDPTDHFPSFPQPQFFPLDRRDSGNSSEVQMIDPIDHIDLRSGNLNVCDLLNDTTIDSLLSFLTPYTELYMQAFPNATNATDILRYSRRVFFWLKGNTEAASPQQRAQLQVPELKARELAHRHTLQKLESTLAENLRRIYKMSKRQKKH